MLFDKLNERRLRLLEGVTGLIVVLFSLVFWPLFGYEVTADTQNQYAPLFLLVGFVFPYVIAPLLIVNTIGFIYRKYFSNESDVRESKLLQGIFVLFWAVAFSLILLIGATDLIEKYGVIADPVGLWFVIGLVLIAIGALLGVIGLVRGLRELMR